MLYVLFSFYVLMNCMWVLCQRENLHPTPNPELAAQGHIFGELRHQIDLLTAQMAQLSANTPAPQDPVPANPQSIPSHGRISMLAVLTVARDLCCNAHFISWAERGFWSINTAQFINLLTEKALARPGETSTWAPTITSCSYFSECLTSLLMARR